jgi:hypothetical protein
MHVDHHGNNRRISIANGDNAHLIQLSSEVATVLCQLVDALLA